MKPTSTLSLFIATLTLALLGATRIEAQTGTDTGYGVDALQDDSDVNNMNSGFGYQTLASNTTSMNSTAVGAFALLYNTAGDNTAVGSQSMYNNQSGTGNTAIGSMSLYGGPAYNNIYSSGSYNTAAGYEALQGYTRGSLNTADGAQALQADSTGNQNTADGAQALLVNTTGGNNTASGFAAMSANTTGYANTASGVSALSANTSGYDNVAIGFNALENNTTGHDDIAIGYGADTATTGNNNICIGSAASSGGSNAIHIGTQGIQNKTVIAGIYKATAASGVAVYVNSNGQLGTLTSSAKFKKNIRDMGDVSKALMSLRPVTFQYKSEIDPTGTPQFGLVAEEVEKVNPDLVARDDQHNIYTVRYEAVNALMLNEVQKQHATIEQQQATIAAQQKMLQSLSERLARVEHGQAK